jgi:hypothetical protein
MEERFLEKTDFENYKDFVNNYKLKIPENFNFAYDVMDEIAKNNPNGKALVWTNDEGDYLEISFAKMKELAEPTIKEAFGKCVEQGASRIIVSPYFLSPGRHWKQVCLPSLLILYAEY